MILYAITDRKLAPEGDLLRQASSLIRAGVDWLQVREKDLDDRTLYAAVKMLSPEARRFGVTLLMNGRPDIAAAAGASGVHLPSDGLPTARVREQFPSPFFIVRSCHALEEIDEAARGGADAVVLGPVFATPSKTELGEAMGLHDFAAICAQSPIPVLGLGGIMQAEVGAVLEAGATGVAAIRMFCTMRDPIAGVAELRKRGA